MRTPFSVVGEMDHREPAQVADGSPLQLLVAVQRSGRKLGSGPARVRRACLAVRRAVPPRRARKHFQGNKFNTRQHIRLEDFLQKHALSFHLNHLYLFTHLSTHW